MANYPESWSFSPHESQRLCRVLNNYLPSEINDLIGHRVALHTVHFLYSSRVVSAPEHAHDYYEAIVVLHGRYHYSTHPHQEIQTGHLVYYPPGTRHAWETLEPDCLRMAFALTITPIAPFTRPAVWPQAPDLLCDVQQLFQELQRGASHQRSQVYYRLSLLLLRIWEYANADKQQYRPYAAEDAGCYWVETAVRYVRDNLAIAHSLDSIATTLGVSRRTLTRYFREQTGMSVTEYVRFIRLEQVATLLLETDERLIAIGQAVGIPDTSYLCTLFRHQYGMTPGQYRAIKSS